jgi:plastocyanin
MKIHFLTSAKRSHFRLAALLALALGSTGWPGVAKAANDPAEPPRDAPRNEVRIAATEFKFSAPSGQIVAGEPMTLILDNSEGESEHAIFFQSLGVRLFAQAGETVRKTVVFDKPGDFFFVCDLPGHREAGMIGKLTIHSAGDASRAVVGQK